MRSTAFLENRLRNIGGIGGIRSTKNMRHPHPLCNRASHVAWKFLLPISIYRVNVGVGENKSPSAARSSVML